MRWRLRNLLCMITCFMALYWLPINAYAMDEIIAPVLDDADDYTYDEAYDEVYDGIIAPVLDGDIVYENNAPVVEQLMMRSAVPMRANQVGEGAYTVYIGMKRNGVFLPGVEIELYDNNDVLLDSATTNADTYVAFSGVSNGVYRIRTISVPDGYLIPEEQVAVVESADETINVSMQVGVELPSTGSFAMPVLYLVGTSLVMLSLMMKTKNNGKKDDSHENV